MLKVSMKVACELFLALQDIDVTREVKGGGKTVGRIYVGGMGTRLEDRLKNYIDIISKRLKTAKTLNKYVSRELDIMFSQDELNAIAEILEKWEEYGEQV